MLSKSELYTLDELNKIGQAMQQSGFFSDIKTGAQTLVKILAGKEMGFAPFTSVNGVNIVQGKPVISANLMGAALKRSNKYNYKATINDKKASVEFFELINGKSVSIGISEFTIEDAAKAGLINKDNWKKYPKNMLFARALSNGIRFYCPDVMNGNVVYTPDELGASEDEEGNLIKDENSNHEKIKHDITNCLTVEALKELYRNSDKESKTNLLGLFKSKKEEIIEKEKKITIEEK